MLVTIGIVSLKCANELIAFVSNHVAVVRDMTLFHTHKIESYTIYATVKHPIPPVINKTRFTLLLDISSELFTRERIKRQRDKRRINVG